MNGMTSTTPKTTASDALAIDTEVVIDLLVGFLREEVHKVGFSKVVLGLSGGIDSALTAALATRALGPENVIAVIMPYRTSDPASKADALEVCESLRLHPIVSEISPQIDAYFANLPDADNRRRGNKMARERMTILYDISFAQSALVAGTSNKTELLLGYSTIYGDMASALNPLGDLYKTQVYDMSAAVELPRLLLSKAPSADLWVGQSDETELGFTYALVDSLLYYMVDERRLDNELVELGFEAEFAQDIRRRVRDSQYKRRPPLIAKLSARTIDRDFRYPRDWGH